MKATVSKTLLAMAMAATPLMASAVQLEDYTVANSSYDEAYVSGDFSALEPSGNAENEQIGYSYSMNADYTKSFSTLPRSWSYNLGLNASGNRPNSSKQSITNPLYTTALNTFNADTAAFNQAVIDNVLDDAGVAVPIAPVTSIDPRTNGDIPQNVEIDTEANDDWQATAEGVVDTYFHTSQYPKAFWFGQGSYKHQDSLPSDDISATVGLGYGRVYNATPLAKVIRIVEELNEEGLLTGPIPDSVALETAEIIDRIQEFKSKFGEDDYKPDYYAAIEEALARSGALRDGKLGAMGALTADKVLVDEPISTRKHGWVVRLGAGFQASDLSGLADNDPKLLAQWEYAKPYGYKGQFINLFSFEPVFGNETLTKFRNDMSYTHEVTDMIDWVNTWSMNYSDGTDDMGNPKESTTHNLSSRYSFDLGNSLEYFVGLRLSQTDIDPNAPGSIGDDPEIEFKTGFNYRLK